MQNENRGREFVIEETPGLVLARMTEVLKLDAVTAEAFIANATTFVRFKTSAAKPFNVFEHFVEHSESVLLLAQRMAGVELSAEQRGLAERLGMETCPAVVKPSLRALVDVWRQEPALAGFAGALAANALPGDWPTA